MRVLFIGKDNAVAERLSLSIRLRWPTFDFQVAGSANEGLDLAGQDTLDLVVVLPDFHDMSLSRLILELRNFPNVPLLVLSRDGDTTEAITALELGADDYVRLPCDTIEMMVRIWALMRRSGLTSYPQGGKPVRSGDLLVNPTTYEVSLGEQPLHLTSTEFRLLHLLVKNRGMVLSHQNLERVLWDAEVDSKDLLKKYVQRLRRKLGDDASNPRWIASIKGVGYRFVGPTPHFIGPAT